MTDFEDTEEILEGPPLDAGETDEYRPGQLERWAETVCSYRHVSGAFSDLLRGRLDPT
jgi:hypothetical protein